MKKATKKNVIIATLLVTLGVSTCLASYFVRKKQIENKKAVSLNTLNDEINNNSESNKNDNLPNDINNKEDNKNDTNLDKDNDNDNDNDKDKDIDDNKDDDETNKNTVSANLQTKELNWYFMVNKNSIAAPRESSSFLSKYGGYYLGRNDTKELYLTFDEGYENGYTSKILDTLKDNDVKAAFFVTLPYMKSNPDLIKRMENEGHLVCNHSNHHPSMPSIKDEEKFKRELSDVSDYYKKLTGKDMVKYFRPPMGKYSEQSLSRTYNEGYKTIFWSFAYKDWEVDNQPSHSEAKNKILSTTKNGSIMLLHAVSKTNTEILDDVLKELKSKGYKFKPLTELP